MGQQQATKHVTMYPTIALTKGQNAAFAYLLANTNQGQIELLQTIFDAGLVKLFQAATRLHGEYLQDVAAATKEVDNGENPS